MNDNIKVPNFDTFSTLVDRLTIEIVKRAHFEFMLESQSATLNEASKNELHRKIAIQNDITHVLRQKLADFLRETLAKGSYKYIDEERTFS